MLAAFPKAGFLFHFSKNENTSMVDRSLVMYLVRVVSAEWLNDVGVNPEGHETRPITTVMTNNYCNDGKTTDGTVDRLV